MRKVTLFSTLTWRAHICVALCVGVLALLFTFLAAHISYSFRHSPPLLPNLFR